MPPSVHTAKAKPGNVPESPATRIAHDELSPDNGQSSIMRKTTDENRHEGLGRLSANMAKGLARARPDRIARWLMKNGVRHLPDSQLRPAYPDGMPQAIAGRMLQQMQAPRLRKAAPAL